MNTTFVNNTTPAAGRRRLGGLIAALALASSVVAVAASADANAAWSGADRSTVNAAIADFPPYLIAQAQRQLLDAEQQARVDAANAELMVALGRTRANFEA